MIDKTPLWQKAPVSRYAKLDRNADFDVVVVGGGVTGLTAAWMLKQAGRTVAVLERGRLGSGDTGYTTAHLTYVTDKRLSALVKSFGEQAAGLTWQAGRVAQEVIERICDDQHIRCEFRRCDGYLHVPVPRGEQRDAAADEQEARELAEEAQLAQRLGFAAEFVDSVPVVNRPGICFSNQAKFQPRAYLAGLAKAIHGDGCEIFEHTEAGEVQAEPLVVKSGPYQIRAGYLVIATHVPLMGTAGLLGATFLQSKLALYSSYVVSASLETHDLPDISLWDTNDPYDYVRIDAGRNGTEIIYGGEDHKTGQVDDTEVCFEKLKSKLLALFPKAKFDHRWSGQVVETNDGLPYLGETAPHQFAATGYAGNGLTFGTLAGLMACDAALGRENPWQDLFSIERTKIRHSAWDYLQENFDFPLYFIKDRLRSAEGNSVQGLKPGEGKILKLDGQRVACSRSDDGTLQAVSPVCTHLGCLVHWNRAEGTWDCPCHGSRFKASGDVLAGPAETPLEAYPIDAQGHLHLEEASS